MTEHGSPDGAEQRLQRLESWRESLDPGHRGKKLRDEDLQRIALSNAKDAAATKRVPMVSNPRLLRELAEEIAQVLAGPEPDEAPDAEAQPQTAPGTPASSRREEAASTPLPDVSQWRFVPGDLSQRSSGNRVSLNVEVLADGIRLSWPPISPSTGIVVYRLVTGENTGPPAPEHGSLVETTLATEGRDDREFTRAVRYYQVWVNTGRDAEDARNSQPRLHAAAEVIAPVREFTITEDEGVVVGRWRAAPGTSRVAVHRSAPGAGYSPLNELEGDDNLLGFQDTTPVPGETYEYSVYAIAAIDGVARQSAGISRQLTVSARLDPVTDLEVRQSDKDGQAMFELVWTPPEIGEVRIFRTESEPNPGLMTETRGLDVIEREGLDATRRVIHPPQLRGGRAVISGVPWPAGWPRAHFTPVTVLGDMARVGNSEASVRAEPVRGAVLVERVDRQIVVFGWPQGMAQVSAYVTPQGAELGDPSALPPQWEISRKDYERFGGLGLQLRGEPVDVHLVSKMWDRGRVVCGEPYRISYRGLLRIAYELQAIESPPNRGGLFRGQRRPPPPTGRFTVRLSADRDLRSTPDMVLVHNPARLPISGRDGRPVAQVPNISLGRGVPIAACEVDLSERRGGYVRLFVAQPNLQVGVAVLDPDIATLRRS